MKKKLIASVLALTTVMSGTAAFAHIDYLAGGAHSEIPAFPAAEGSGMYTTGARGDFTALKPMEVYHVTNLNDSGEGSFRDAVSSGNRIIVFDVSGMIDLQSRVSIGHDNVTILGQTAPGNGICFRGNSVKINGKNIILRYLRFRPGAKLADGSDTITQDGLSIPIGAEDIILDHCSISWGTDENLSVIGGKNITVQNCIIAEALNSSIHDKGEHSYGGIWGGVNVSFHHNIIATHKSRNPKIGTSETVSMTPGYTDEETVVDMWNNIIYNWGDKAGYGAENGANVNIVNNYYKPGPATPDEKRARIFELSPGNKYQTKWSGDIYASGNYIDDEGADAALVNAENWQIDAKTGVYLDAGGIDTYNKLESLRTSSYLYDKEIQTAQEAYEDVISNAGARLPKLDLVDSRIIENVTNRTAPAEGSHGSKFLIDDPVDGIPEGQEDLYDGRGYPLWVPESRAAEYDADGDGIADEWEDKMGLDNTNPNDSLNIGPDGYTWLEIFGESLISDNTVGEGVQISSGEGNDVTLAVNAADVVKAEFYSGGTLIAESDEMLVQGIESGDTVIVAGYNDGALAEVKSEVYGDDFEMPSVSGNEKSVFIWDSLDGMKPVDGALFGYFADTLLDRGMNVISAKIYSADGISKITPVTVVTVEGNDDTPQEVSGDFEIVGTIDNIPNIVKNVYKGIYADDFVIAAGYNDEFKSVIRYGKKSNEALSEKDNKGYKYIKIAVRNGHADLYAASTIGVWDKLSENGYDYKGMDPTAGAYEINPENKDYAAVVPWKIVTDFTKPELTVNNIDNNTAIGFNENMNITVKAADNTAVEGVYVLCGDEVIASKTGIKVYDEAETLNIPLSFTKPQDADITVICYDDNYQSTEVKLHIYVSADYSPWEITDIGADSVETATYMYATDDYTYKIGGTDGLIGGTSDKFGYVYQKFTGDNRIYYRSRMQSGEQFGIMLRKSLDADSESYFFGGEYDNGALVYSMKSRNAAGGETTTTATDDLSGANLYFIAEKAGNILNIYQTENSATVYTTKKLLHSIDVSVLGDEYYMGFASVYGGEGNPPDAGWIGIDNCSGDSYVWNFDCGLDWCWQIQEANVLSPKWTTETIGGNDTGKMVLAPDDTYSGERYIFHEYIMDDEYVPEMSADVMLTGDEPAMNVYLQAGSANTAYKITFDSDKKIKDASGSEIGEWDSTGFYRIVMSVGIDEATMENKCEARIIRGSADDITNIQQYAAVIPADSSFRTQNNVEKKTPVTRAVYFEPAAGADGTYYIDNVSVNAAESDFVIEKNESWYVFKDISSIDGAFTVDGLKSLDGTELSGGQMSVASGAELKTGNKSADGIAFTNRIRIKNDSGKITLPVESGSVVTVYGASANSSSTRPLYIDGTKYDLLAASASVYKYTGDDGTIEIYGGDNIEIYGISVVTTKITAKK